MFALPPMVDERVSLLGIDPGSDTMGYGIIHCHAHTLQIVAAEAFTVKASRIPGHEWLGEHYLDRTRRLQVHSEQLARILWQYRPLCAAHESPFINPKMPSAFAPLVESVYILRTTIAAQDPWLSLYSFSPSEVKNGVGAKGGADKDAVKKAIAQNTPLAQACGPEFAGLDEHSLDALAVAYCLYLGLTSGTLVRT